MTRGVMTRGVMTRGFTKLALTALALSLTTSAWAGGFSIYEAGARATGLGCAFTATADDGSAMFYNIAGISFLQGNLVDLSLMPIAPRIKFTGVTPSFPNASGETKHDLYLSPGFGASHPLNEHWTVGLGFYAPFGLGVKWQDPERWVGRFTSYDVELQTYLIVPAVSYRFSDKLAIGVGADVSWQHITLNRYQGTEFGGNNELVNVIDVALEGTSDLNVVPSVGVMARPTPKLSLGAMYHHEKTLKYSGGTGTLTNVAPDALRDAVDAQIAALGGTDYALTTEIGLPHMLSLGAAYQVHPRARIEVDAVHFSWSNFAELPITFFPDVTGQLSTVVPEKYKDVWQIRAGAQLDLAPGWQGLLGYVRDNTPQPKASMSPLLPDADRNDWSLGVQHRRGAWTYTASAMFVVNQERDNLVNGQVALFPEEAADPDEIARKQLEAGSYTALTTVLAFGVGYQF